MQEPTQILPILIQGGAVGLAVVTLWILYKLVGNHMNHATDATNQLTVAITKLITYLETRDDN